MERLPNPDLKPKPKSQLSKSNSMLFFFYFLLNVVAGGLLISGYSENLFHSTGFFIGYILFILGLFVYAGYSILPKHKEQKLLSRLFALSSVPLVGLIIWTMNYRFLPGSQYRFFDVFAWFPYLLYTLWAIPLYSYLEFFFENNQKTFAVLGLSLSLLPSLGALGGVYLRLYKKELIEKLQDTKYRKRFIFTSMALLVFLSSPFVLEALKTYPFTPETYPRIDGATASIPMARVFAQELTGMSRRDAHNFIRFNTTHNAYVNLIEKRVDLIFVAEPSKDELALASEKGVALELTPVGRDAFIFVVHKSNPVDGLTLEQIQKIYTGEITNWNEVGGLDEPIIAYQRQANSGSQTLMENHVMRGLPMMTPPTERRIGGMGEILDAVADYSNSRGSLGYSVYYYASQMHKNESIKFLAINGIGSNQSTIADGTYPLSGNLYAVTRKDEPADSPASQMLRWITSPKGQKAVAKGGFVPLATE